MPVVKGNFYLFADFGQFKFIVMMPVESEDPLPVIHGVIEAGKGQGIIAVDGDIGIAFDKVAGCGIDGVLDKPSCAVFQAFQAGFVFHLVGGF